MNYFYGPVPSRRLGFSLGVDLIPKKTCSFDCLYCQIGHFDKNFIRRRYYINDEEFKRQLKKILAQAHKIDYITISGSGEPTLHKNLDKVVALIRKITKNKYPICLITNSSLLYREDVRNEIKAADLIIPSLDAAGANTFQKINRPHKALKYLQIVEGLVKLRRVFKGKIWLEIMLIKGINDTMKSAKEFKKIIERIKPDKVQINLPLRPGSVALDLPSKDSIEKFKKTISLATEVVSDFKRKGAPGRNKVQPDKEIINFLKVRPATLKDLNKSLGIDKSKLKIYLNKLLEKKYIIKKGNYFFNPQ